MACGMPVVTSNTSSLPEVAGDAALMVPPTDVRALREAMERALSDEHLQARMRAREFSWAQAARETVRIYERAAAFYRA